MNTKYIELLKWLLRLNTWLSAFIFFALTCIIFILAAVGIAGVFYPNFSIPNFQPQPLLLLFLATLKAYFFWRVFRLCLNMVKNLNLVYLVKVRHFLLTIFCLSVFLYLLELPQILGPFDNFLRMGPTEAALANYSILQLSIYYLIKFFSLDLSGVVSLVLILITFVVESLSIQNQLLRQELDEVI